MTRQHWDNENEAAGIVALLVGADSIEKLDRPGAPPGTHDFNLRVREKTIALEVTSTSDNMLRKLWGAIGENPWKEPSLSSSWTLAVAPDTNVRALRSELATHLRILEQLQVWSFHKSRAPHYAAHWAKDRLCELGVEMGFSSTELTSQITIGIDGGLWVPDPEVLPRMIQPEIDANIEKLRGAHADERHLFVWVSTANVSLGQTMSSIVEEGVVPSTPLPLPPGLDVLWVARAAISYGGRPVIKNTGSGWEVVANEGSRPMATSLPDQPHPLVIVLSEARGVNGA